MKKTIILAVTILLIGISGVKAQEKDSLIYEIEYEFTGEIVNGFDSVFNVYLIVEPSELEKFVQFEVDAVSVFDKTKKLKKEINSSVVKLDKQADIRADKKVRISLGTSKATDCYIWEAKGLKMVMK